MSAAKGTRPTRPGQLVRSSAGVLGVTTGEPMKRTPRIGVMLVGFPYEINLDLDELTVVDAP